MFHVALHEPEIAPNTGNLMRLTVNTGCRLHLIEPLGFSLDEAKVRRAGLDYREYADVERYSGWTDFVARMGERRVFVLLASGQDSALSAIDARAPDLTRFQALDTGFVDSIVARHAARILTDDHAPLSYLMGFERVVD